MTPKKHGGRRNNSGRKKVKDKKVALYIYPCASDIRDAGGKDKARKIALYAVVSAAMDSRDAKFNKQKEHGKSNP